MAFERSFAFCPALLTVRQRQPRDHSQHAAKTLPREVPFGQEQPIVARMFNQPSAGLHQALLQARQRPVPPRIAESSNRSFSQSTRKFTLQDLLRNSRGDLGFATAISCTPCRCSGPPLGANPTTSCLVASTNDGEEARTARYRLPRPWRYSRRGWDGDNPKEAE